MNPHTRYEIPLYRVPRWISIVVVLVTAAVLIGVVCLYASYEPDLFRAPKLPKVPNVSAAIQQKVDDTVKEVVKQ